MQGSLQTWVPVLAILAHLLVQFVDEQREAHGGWAIGNILLLPDITLSLPESVPVLLGLGHTTSQSSARLGPEQGLVHRKMCRVVIIFRTHSSGFWGLASFPLLPNVEKKIPKWQSVPTLWNKALWGEFSRILENKFSVLDSSPYELPWQLWRTSKDKAIQNGLLQEEFWCFPFLSQPTCLCFMVLKALRDFLTHGIVCWVTEDDCHRSTVQRHCRRRNTKALVRSAVLKCYFWLHSDHNIAEHSSRSSMTLDSTRFFTETSSVSQKKEARYKACAWLSNVFKHCILCCFSHNIVVNLKDGMSVQSTWS